MTQVAILGRKAKFLTAFNSTQTNLDDAIAVAQLKRGELDFGTIGVTVGIIVYEHSLLKGNPDEYYRLGKQLFNGNAVLFKTNLFGKTINFPIPLIKHLNECSEVEFFLNREEVEKAIASGRVIRPFTAINGAKVWEWNR